jgi:hypothetical protein
MLDVDKYGETLDEIGYSDVLLRFLTDDERRLLAQIVAQVDPQRPTRQPAALERAGRILYSAQRRAEMRHPGFE